MFTSENKICYKLDKLWVMLINWYPTRLFDNMHFLTSKLNLIKIYPRWFTIIKHNTNSVKVSLNSIEWCRRIKRRAGRHLLHENIVCIFIISYDLNTSLSYDLFTLSTVIFCANYNVFSVLFFVLSCSVLFCDFIFVFFCFFVLFLFLFCFCFFLF